MLDKIEGKRRKGGQRIRWLDGITVSMDMISNKFRKKVENWHAAFHGVGKESNTT